MNSVRVLRSAAQAAHRHATTTATLHNSRFLYFSSISGAIVRPTRITPLERAALRAARRERGRRILQQQQQQGDVEPQTIPAAVAAAGMNVVSSSGTTAAAQPSKARSQLFMSRWIWYLGVGVPTALLAWGIQDENSPPARFSELIGFTGIIRRFADEINKPSYDKLLPDWSQMPNVPHDIPVPHTLVLDLENTLVSSTWDRKHGWRHAKRPGVDQFLRTLAMYYEIVLYSPSIDGVADPVVTSLDKEGCIMHRLYRDATHFHNGVHVKDLDRLNRNVKKIIVVDDDPAEVQFHPYNVLRVKPYTDPTDRTDDTLARITPFLVEIAREGYDDIPTLMRQYEGMDADAIADEQERRVAQIRYERQQRSSAGLSGLARGSAGNLPPPELPPSSEWMSSSFGSSGAGGRTVQLTAKDIAGAMPPSSSSDLDFGLVGWMQRRAKEKEEHQMRKLEKWNEVMMEKQRKRKQQEQQQV